jgi:Flp pilus assembly protein TadD
LDIEVLIAENKKESALSKAIKLATEHQDNPQVILPLASLLLDLGNERLAEDALKHVLELDPNLPKAHLLYGRINRHHGNLDQAVHNFSQAIALDPSLIEAYSGLGKTFQQRREHPRASELYLQALKLFPNEPRLYWEAGIVYKESKDFKNAEVMLRKAAKLDPNNTHIRRALASVVALNIVNNLQETHRK